MKRLKKKRKKNRKGIARWPGSEEARGGCRMSLIC